jgi:LysR family hydrogen peroxide-inducible transcriptional activator
MVPAALPYTCGEVETEVLFDDQLLVAFPREAQEPPEQITAEAIDPDRLLLLEDGHCLRDHALAACNRPEIRAQATMLGTSLHTLVQMVDNGLGTTMLPQMAVDAGILDHTNIVARPLKGEQTAREIALIWRKNSPREKDFRMLADLLRKAAV